MPAIYHLVIFYVLTHGSFVPLFPGIGTGVTTTQFFSPLSLLSSKTIIICIFFLHLGMSSVSHDISEIIPNTDAAVLASSLNPGLHQANTKTRI